MSKKSKKSKQGISNIMIVLVLILVITNAATLYYFMFGPGVRAADTVPAEDVPMGMADVLGDPAYIGETVTLLGYLVITAGNHLLVSNPMLVFNNSLDPGNYVVLRGTLPPALNETFGMQIAVKGELGETQITGGGSEFFFDSFFDITYEPEYKGTFVDVKLNPYREFAGIPYLFDATEEKYAVLYSGGINTDKDHYRYWNDIIYMYFILQMHGYDPDNIYVIYKDGVSEDGYTPVDYPATHASLDTVFGLLSEEMGRADTLFFYTTNHGGSGGISVWNAMDSSGALTHSQVSNWLDSITCRYMIIVMEQCVSGKFITHLSS
ncbi:MAG: hypothetical protein P1Q69_10110 [Candidatus Thorarchaeota archaeon]|nr:hypothetical protein [Candidatus Thorarchaeota archaeon]